LNWINHYTYPRVGSFVARCKRESVFVHAMHHAPILDVRISMFIQITSAHTWLKGIIVIRMRAI
jgi:hypothetical protein